VEPAICTPTMAAATWRRMTFLVSDGHNDVAALERMRRMGHEWLRKSPGKTVDFVVIHPSNTTMSSEERATMMRYIDETKHNRLASATVVLATGILGAVHRSILTGMNLIVPPPHPARICADVATGARFVERYADHLCGPVTAEMIEDIAGGLHARILAAKAKADDAGGPAR
jgi:hypothetical protein